MKLLVLGATSPAQAQAQDILRGQDFARTNCARCHSIEKSGASPFAGAPPFRTLHLRGHKADSLDLHRTSLFYRDGNCFGI